MFLFKSKPEIHERLYALIPSFNTSSQDFYTAVEEDLKAREVPGLQTSRVEYAEGGLLSDKRLYLHFERERITFDICAAPFGTAYFFSCRMGEHPAGVRWWHLLILLAGLGFWALLSFFLLAYVLGLLTPFAWPFVFLAVPLLAIFAMRNSRSLGLKDLDAVLLNLPVINTIYEAWIRRETYYREDTRRMYLDTLKAVVKEHVEELTAAKGITLVTYQEQSAAGGMLYKPTAVELPERAVA
jgi:hypothetical protein